MSTHQTMQAMTHIIDLLGKYIKNYYNCILYAQEIRGYWNMLRSDMNNTEEI